MLGPPRARSIACTGASPRLGAVFPQSARALPPGASSDEEEKEEQLPSIRKVSGGAKVGFFHDFGLR